jgi:capsid portal protein
LEVNQRKNNVMAGKGQIEPRWQKGESGNPNGRPKGTRNRSTIVREWLEVQQSVKNPITGEQEVLEQQDIMTLALIKKAREGDVNAYRELMDSAHGKQTNQIEGSMHLTGLKVEVVDVGPEVATNESEIID